MNWFIQREWKRSSLNNQQQSDVSYQTGLEESVSQYIDSPLHKALFRKSSKAFYYL